MKLKTLSGVFPDVVVLAAVRTEVSAPGHLFVKGSKGSHFL